MGGHLHNQLLETEDGLTEEEIGFLWLPSPRKVRSWQYES